jgi:hypothetical protein
MALTPRFTGILVVAFFCALLTGCQSKITKANYEKVTEGMNLKEVENILGEGTKLGDASGTAAQFGVNLPAAKTVGGGDTYYWESGDKKITVIFVQDKVKWKDSKGL